MDEGDGPGRRRALEALQRMPRGRAHQILEKVLSYPAVQMAAARIQQEELRAGAELQPRFQAFADRYRQAVDAIDHDTLSRICPGKHHQWGRACVLDADHMAATGALHWGLTANGDPIAWVGTAPDDD